MALYSHAHGLTVITNHTTPKAAAKTVIDSLHFVSSHASPGVQMADLVAYAIQRQRRTGHHTTEQAAMDRLSIKVNEHVRTWRELWPR